MRRDWRTVALQALCEKVQSGGTPSTKRNDFYGGEIPWIKTKEVNFNRIYDSENKITELGLKKSSAKLIPKRSIIIAMYGNGDTAGRCAINMIPLATNQACTNFTFDEKLALPEFMFYLISTHYRDFVHLKSGGAQNNLNGKTLKEFKVFLPPLPTQRKIASILTAYDDLIENNLRRIKLLEEMAQLTYEEWFVRMKFPGHETTAVDEETGLPEGWERKSIGEVCNISGGGTPSRKNDEYWDNGDLTWFSPTDLSKANSLCVLDSSQKITQLGLQKSSAKMLEPDSFMMTSRATIGLFAIIDKPFSTNQGFINVTPSQPIEKEYLLYNFITRIEEFKGYATGSTFPELSKSKFKVLKIVWPTKAILEKYHFLASKVHKQLFNLTIQNQLLKEARDILLLRLMTGMIDVEELNV